MSKPCTAAALARWSWAACPPASGACWTTSNAKRSSPGADPFVHGVLHHRQRQRAVAQQQVVEGADVEVVAKRLAGPVAQFDHAQVADLVRAVLARLDQVAVDLDAHAVAGQAGLFAPVVDSPFAAPSLAVLARVPQQPYGPEHRRLRLPSRSSAYTPISAASCSTYRAQPSVKALGFSVRRIRGRSVSDWPSAIWKWCPGAPSW